MRKRFSDTQAARIRKAYENTTLQDLARTYGMSLATAWDIIHAKGAYTLSSNRKQTHDQPADHSFQRR